MDIEALGGEYKGLGRHRGLKRLQAVENLILIFHIYTFREELSRFKTQVFLSEAGERIPTGTGLKQAWAEICASQPNVRKIP